MSDSFTVGSTSAVLVGAQPDNQKKIHNGSGSALHYKTSSDVTTSDSSISAGSSLTIDATNWLISAGTTHVLVEDSASDVTHEDVTITDQLTVAGVLTPSAGVAPISQPACLIADGGLPSVATSGTDTAFADGTLFLNSVFVPANFSATGVGYLVGSVGGTDKVIVNVWNSAGVHVIGSTVTAGGTTAGTAAEIQSIAFTAVTALQGPRRYFIGISANGGTAKIRTKIAQTGAKAFTGSVSQTHAATTTVTPPSAFAADKGPWAFLY